MKGISVFLLVLMFPVLMAAQRRKGQVEDLFIQRANFSCAVAYCSPFLRNESYGFVKAVPLSFVVPMVITYTPKYETTSIRHFGGFSITGDLSFRVYKKINLVVGCNYTMMYSQTETIHYGTITNNGYAIKNVRWESREGDGFFTTGIEIRPSPWILAQAGFIHDVFQSNATIYLNPELSKKSEKTYQSAHDAFMGQYLDASVRLSKWPYLYLHGRLLHRNRPIVESDKRGFSFTVGLRFFLI